MASIMNGASADRCIGGMATIPERVDALQKTLDSVLDQFDHLYIYLNSFPSIPSFWKMKR